MSGPDLPALLVRRFPLTITYTLVLILTGAWLDVTAPERAHAFELAISTNLENLGRTPIVLLTSLVAPAGENRWLFLGLVVLAMGSCEAWLGALRTLGLYVGGNVAATLVVAAWIDHAIGTGRYDPSVRSAIDYGVSYGLNTLLFTLVARPARLWANLLLAVLAVGWLALESPWEFLDSDFSGLGHIVAAGLGLSVAIGILLRRAWRGTLTAATGPRTGW